MHQISHILQIASIKEKYSIQKQIGEGAFAKVYLATTKKSFQKVALKCIDLQQIIDKQKNQQIKLKKIQLLKSEVFIMKMFDHPNLLKLIQVIQHKRVKILVLQYCEESLYDEIERLGKIPEKKAAEIFDQLTQGFAMLHFNNVIHRDIKTQNILVNNGVYKISDFGSSRVVPKILNKMTMTRLGSRCTTAPQVLNGEDYGTHADLWSLGVVYYQMLTGRLPYKIISEQAIKKSLDYLNKLEISEQTIQLIKQMLTIDQSKRLTWLKLYKRLNNKKQHQKKQNLIIKPYEHKIETLSIQQRFFIGNFDPNIKQISLSLKASKQIFIRTISLIQNLQNSEEVTKQIITQIFFTLIFSQCKKILEHHKDFLHNKQQQIKGIYSELSQSSSIVNQLNSFYEQLCHSYAQNVNKLDKNLQSNKPKHITLKQQQQFSIKYMIYDCQPEQHIQFTKRIFNILYDKILKFNKEKNTEQIKQIKEFMNDKYQLFVIQKEVMNNGYNMNQK